MLQAAGDDPRYGIGYAVAAYVVIFVAFFGYVGFLHVSHARLRRRLASLEEAVEGRLPSGGE